MKTEQLYNFIKELVLQLDLSAFESVLKEMDLIEFFY